MFLLVFLSHLHDLCEWGAKEGLNRLRNILKVHINNYNLILNSLIILNGSAYRFVHIFAALDQSIASVSNVHFVLHMILTREFNLFKIIKYLEC